MSVRVRRAWRLWRAEPKAVQAIGIAAVAVLLAGTVALGSRSDAASSGHDRLAAGRGQGAAAGPGGTAGGATTTSAPGGDGAVAPGGDGTAIDTNAGGGGSDGGGGGGDGGGGAACPDQLGASDRGVSPTSVKVVFPYLDLGAVGQISGLDTSSEDNPVAIKTYVDDINAHGGINCRMIDPEIVSYNPLDDADMRAKCKDWTETQQVFAVVDSVGWHDDHQLCITEEGKTPLISGWTTVPDWTQRGNPYLWWTGPSQADVLENLVVWAKTQGYLDAGTKFAIVAADRESDKLALNNYLLPALERAGLKPTLVESIHFDSVDQATGQAQAPLVVQRLKAAQVSVVFPLLPFTSFLGYLQNAESQSYYPRLLLSDYESTLAVALGLDEVHFKKTLDNMTGPTSFVLGNRDIAGSYTPAEDDCYKVWTAHNPDYVQDHESYDGNLESTGTAMTWCQNIRLFAEAARRAGADLTRDGFNQAMMTINGFQGTVAPEQSYSADRRAGPHLFRTVQVHLNTDKACPLKADGGDQGSCWLIVQDFQEMQRT